MLLVGWNMQGNVNTVNLPAVVSKSVSGKIPDVVCLQECGNLLNQFNFGPPNQDGVMTAIFQYTSTSRSTQTWDVVFLPNPVPGQTTQFSLAILSSAGMIGQGGTLLVPNMADPPSTRPLLWIDVPNRDDDDAWRIGCVHAPSYYAYKGQGLTDQQIPGATADWNTRQLTAFQAMAAGLAPRTPTNWAVLGDFNCDPQVLNNALNQQAPNMIIEFGPRATQQAGFQIDYLVTTNQNITNFIGGENVFGNSDHYPQAFTLV